MISLLIGLVFFSFFLGYFMRETMNILVMIKNQLKALRIAQDKDKPPTADFAEPMSRAEVAGMMEQERIDLLNQ